MPMVPTPARYRRKSLESQSLVRTREEHNRESMPPRDGNAFGNDVAERYIRRIAFKH